MTATVQATIRPMEPADLEAAVVASAAAFDVDMGDASRAATWSERVAHPLGTDPDGAFVAELDGRVVGVAQAIRRETLWCLSLLTVDPQAQGGGAGQRLLERSLAYAAPGDTGLIVSSNDARALRIYGRAGFTLLPTFEAEGELNRRALPGADSAVVEVGEDDLHLLEPISRAVRGAAHTPELGFVLRSGARIARIRTTGFAVSIPGRVWLVASRDEETARALLWDGLEHAAGDGSVGVRWITGAQQWALGVVLDAGLRLTAYGALAVRGMPGPLAPFLPSPPFG
jgi:ribosomal protein S18 acetylase RimI-like enzyme